MRDTAFYKELINVSDSECEYTKNGTDSEAENRLAPLEIYSQENPDEWSEKNRKMIAKIVSLCGFSLEQTKLHHFKNTSQLASAFSNENTKYILLFSDTPIIKTINFSLNKIGFSTVGTTKVYYNPKVTDLAENQDAKMRLWNAMQSEFNL